MNTIYEPKGKALEYSPLALNLYNGCGHGCIYCYAPAILYKKREDFLQATPRPGIIPALQKDAMAIAGDPRTILLSFTSDPYQPVDTEMKLTREAIQTLIKNRLTVSILTKGGTRAMRDFDLLAGGSHQFGTTMTFLDPAKSAYYEPHAALPDNRLEAIKEAHRLEIKTWVSLEPIIDPAETLEIIKTSHPYVDSYKLGRLNYHNFGEIDYKKFVHQAIELLKTLNKHYYIKKDLAKFI